MKIGQQHGAAEMRHQQHLVNFYHLAPISHQNNQQSANLMSNQRLENHYQKSNSPLTPTRPQTLTTAVASPSTTSSCTTTIVAATMFLWPIISGLLFSNAQYSAPFERLVINQSGSLVSATGTCDTSRLMRCQQEVVRDMQLVGLNAASIQYPISQGPPYSPAAKLREQQQQAHNNQRLVTPATCRMVRANLDCLLTTTPACYESGLQAAQSSSGDIVLRAKRFLEQNNCNEPDVSWSGTFCYRSPEVRNCEERYGFTVYSSSALAIANSSACLAYQAFKYCLDSHLRLNCKVHEIDMANEYLIDRAGELAWRCPPANSSSAALIANHHLLNYQRDTNAAVISNPYGLSNPNGAILSPLAGYGSGLGSSQYEQRPMYVGSSGSGNGLYGTVNRGEQAWERFRNPYDDSRGGISRLPGGGSGEVFDRIVAGNGFDTETSDCPIKAAPYARECEDTLLEQHRMARDSRDGIELQRRICCSLYQFRDCVSRVVLDRCADSSPAVVEILMGARRREMTLTCRGYNRDLCSGALANALASPILVLITSLLATLITLKRRLD